MTLIIFTIIVFLELLWYVIFFDIILSWLHLLGIQFRPKWLSDIIDPLYSFVRRYIPTRIGILDLTPIVIIFLLIFTRGLILTAFPEAASQMHTLMR